MNYERLYQFRFRDIDQAGRIAVWREISPHVHALMVEHQTAILNPHDAGHAGDGGAGGV